MDYFHRELQAGAERLKLELWVQVELRE